MNTAQVVELRKVAHDFSNLLGVIAAYGELLAEDLEGAAQTYVHGIQEATEQAGHLTARLREMVR
jgi:hypothetical protein